MTSMCTTKDTHMNEKRNEIINHLKNLRHQLHHCEMELIYSNVENEVIAVKIETELSHVSRSIYELLYGPQEEYVLDTPDYWDAYKEVVENQTNQVVLPRLSHEEPF